MKNHKSDLSAQIAQQIRDAIVSGELIVDARLPSEAELAAQFSVSRSTVREALKRLAAQSLIRTQRGATGGAFVNRISFEQAYGQQITTSTLLISMNEVSFATACEARFALERACAPLAAIRRTDADLNAMRAQVSRQQQGALSHEDFCNSDVAFHRALVDAAHNPVLSYQLAGVLEGLQPLMNMLTYHDRPRSEIAAAHGRIVTALAVGDAHATDQELLALMQFTAELGVASIKPRAVT